MTTMTQKRITVDLGDGLRADIAFARYDDKFIKTRVYVTDEVSNESDEKLRELQAEEEVLGSRRWSTRGEFPDVDKLYDQLNRAIGRVKREVAVSAARKIAVDDTITGRFSRKAGCSCPCSPGVILDRVLYYNNGRIASIWIGKW